MSNLKAVLAKRKIEKQNGQVDQKHSDMVKAMAKETFSEVQGEEVQKVLHEKLNEIVSNTLDAHIEPLLETYTEKMDEVLAKFSEGVNERIMYMGEQMEKMGITMSDGMVNLLQRPDQDLNPLANLIAQIPGAIPKPDPVDLTPVKEQIAELDVEPVKDWEASVNRDNDGMIETVTIKAQS